MRPLPPASARPASRRRRLVQAVVLLGGACLLPAGGGLAVVGALVGLATLIGPRLGLARPAWTSRWRLLNTCAFVGLLLAAFARVPLPLVAALLVGWLLVHRALARPGDARDDRVRLLLALLLALLGCILSSSMLLGPLLLGLVLLAPPALLSCHLGLEREAALARRLRPVGEERPLPFLGLGLAALGLAALFFLLLPRIDARGWWGGEGEGRLSGFGEDVRLGELAPLLQSEEPVLRVRTTRADGAVWTGPLYLRGVALDHFDGQRWRSTVERGRRWSAPGASPELRVQQEIVQEPLAEPVLFGLHEVVGLRAPGLRVRRDANGAFRYDGLPQPLRYTVWSVPPSTDPARLRLGRPDPRRSARDEEEARAADERIWTQLPPDLDPRVPALASRLAGEAGPGASPWEQALAIEAWLERELRYSLSPPPTPDGLPPSDPLTWFLFDAREGHCEYYATAMVVLLRSLGHPARLVNGFAGGEPSALGDERIFRQRDAHSWVELNLGAQGWVGLDPTPSEGAPARTAAWWLQLRDRLAQGWQGGLIAYGLDQQLAGLQAIGALAPAAAPARLGPEGAGLVLLLLGLGLGALGLRRLLHRRLLPVAARGPRDPIERLHARARRLLDRRGLRPPPSLPPVEAAAWILQRAGTAAAPLERLAWLLYEVRYGGLPVEDALPEARARFVELRRELPKLRKPPAGGREAD